MKSITNGFELALYMDALILGQDDPFLLLSKKTYEPDPKPVKASKKPKWGKK